MAVHVTLHVSEAVTVTETYADADTINLQGGGTVTAAELTVGNVLADGREVVGLHTPPVA